MRGLGHALPPFQQFLASLQKRYPVLSVSACIDHNGQQVARSAALKDPGVEKYRLLNYDMLRGGQFFWKGESKKTSSMDE